MPHMHLRGKDFQYTITQPGKPAEVLLSVPAYDFGWQSYYTLAEPMTLPKGTRIDCLAHFDNSDEEPVQPRPDKAVRWGDQTFEEMMIGYIDVDLPLGSLDLAGAPPTGRVRSAGRAVLQAVGSSLGVRAAPSAAPRICRRHAPVEDRPCHALPGSCFRPSRPCWWGRPPVRGVAGSGRGPRTSARPGSFRIPDRPLEGPGGAQGQPRPAVPWLDRDPHVGLGFADGKPVGLSFTIEGGSSWRRAR